MGHAGEMGTLVRHPLFTIGYEGRSIDEFVDVLIAADVEVLVDVNMAVMRGLRGEGGAK